MESSTATIKFKKLHENAIIPTRATEHSAGFDLYALEDRLIVGGEGCVVVPTGIAVQLPPGTYGRIAMRSGLSVKEHLAVSGGVIDQDYVLSIGIITYATKVGHSYLIKAGERCAQLIPEMVSYAKSEVVEEFTSNYEEHTGWGSTGK
jgi:dUTP pyrophosphatase